MVLTRINMILICIQILCSKLEITVFVIQNEEVSLSLQFSTRWKGGEEKEMCMHSIIHTISSEGQIHVYMYANCIHINKDIHAHTHWHTHASHHTFKINTHAKPAHTSTNVHNQ